MHDVRWSMEERDFRLVLAAGWLGVAASCSPLTAADGGAMCRPTGWVDRVEGNVAVLTPDQGDEEEYYPVECFAEPPVEGTRVVMGRVDHEQTAATRHAIDAILARILEEPENRPLPAPGPAP